MKHAVVVAHPNPKSFAVSVANAYAQAAEALGHDVLIRDLYRMNFDPRLQADELPSSKGVAARPDVTDERKRLADVRVFAFVYPFWFNAPPAMMKGYIDRVFGMGFGYGPGPEGTEPLLDQCKLISLTSSGAPEGWVHSSGAWEAVHRLFDKHIADVCGMTLVDHLHFGGIVEAIREDAVRDCLDKVAAMVRLHFGERA